MVDERTQVVSFVRRPEFAARTLYGSLGRKLWDDPGGKPPAPPPPPADPPKPPAGDGDLSAKLEKLERDNKRLTDALSKRDQEAERARADREKADREAAERKGEFERLYGEEKTKGQTLAEQLKSERERRESYEQLVSERIEETLKSVEDKELKSTWKKALEGLDPRAQLRTLDALQATAGKARPTTPRPGAPGRSKGTADLRELGANTPAAEKKRQELVLQLVKQLEVEKG